MNGGGRRGIEGFVCGVVMWENVICGVKVGNGAAWQ